MPNGLVIILSRSFNYSSQVVHNAQAAHNAKRVS
tara:strand:+ start:1596 stop:1697 length:102 start_codon:yes stop_codon:yes gene_type:complete